MNLKPGPAFRGLNHNYKQLLDRLVKVVSEQQHTVASLGWAASNLSMFDYSKAGARRFQFDRIQEVLKEIKELEEKRYG